MKLFARLLAGMGVFVVFLAGASSALGSSGLKTITGNTTLTEDHLGNIWFAADSVTLDCAGHSVIGPGVAGPWPGVGIAVVARTDVTIRNCHVQGFGHGISLSTVRSFSLIGNVSSGNSSVGIALYEATNGTLSRNVAAKNGWWGISGQNITDIQFGGNRASDNGYDGFRVFTPWPQVHYSAGLRFVGNTSTGNGLDGLNLSALADGNTLTGNVARDNHWSGLAILSDNNSLMLNQASGNDNGIHITGSDNQLAVNASASNHGNGYALLDGATRNGLRSNLASGNGKDGFVVLGNSPSNQFIGNASWDNVWSGFAILTDNNTLVSSQASGNDNGIHITGSGNRVTMNASSSNRGNGYALLDGATSNALKNNIASSNGRDGFSLWSAPANQFISNVSRDNHFSGFALTRYSDGNELTGNTSTGNNSGFSIESLNNALTTNTAIQNQLYGFVAISGAVSNEIKKNTARWNKGIDAVDKNPPGSNSWIDNRFGTTIGILTSSSGGPPTPPTSP